MPPERMNFIIFNPDEMRAESVGCYAQGPALGASSSPGRAFTRPVSRTPNLDRLAAEGTRFDQCFVQHTVCTPSRCSFMSGWYPHVRGHRTLWNMLRPDEPNLLKYLKEAGYDVHWGGKNDLLAPESFAQSVTDYRLGARSTRFRRTQGHGEPPYHLDDPRYYTFLYEPVQGGIESLNDFRNADGAIELLRARPSEPFLIYLPLSFPHCPYHAPEPFHDLIDPARLPPLRPADLPNKPDFYRLIRQTRRLDQLDEAFFRKLQAVYLGMIATSDALLGMLLDTLEETGLAENTAVFAFSDHGDWAGDYGLVEKWPSALDDVLTRVPFLARIPGGARGHVVREPVEMFDVMATTLELAGIEARHTHFARSQVAQLRGAAGDPARAAFAEGGYDPHEAHAFEGRTSGGAGFRDPSHIYYPKGRLQQDVPESVCRCTMIRTATHKLVRRPLGVSELYETAADPRELRNVYGHPEYAAVQRDLEARLLDWYIHTSDVVPLEEHPRGTPA